MRDSRVDDRNPDKVLLGILDTLSDGGGYLIGFSKTITNNAVLVTHYHDSGEAEVTTTLSDLRHSLDGDQPVLKFKIRGLYSFNICICHSLLQLENKSTFTGTIGQTLDPAVIEISSAVERDLLDPLLLGALGDSLSDDSGGLDASLALALSGEDLVVRSSGHEGHTLLVIDDLGIDLLVASEDNQPRPLSGSIDMLADAVMDPSSSFNFIQCHICVLLII